MADPLSIASSVVALVTFALQSSAVLYTTVRSFQSQDKDVRALKGELGDLTSVLESLLDTVTSHPNLEFDALKIPLHRCGKACQEYGALIERCSKHSTESRPSIRDWITQKYLQGDIDDFRAMLAGYKSTINIALANTNIRVAAVTPRVLEDYRDLIDDATNDLQGHMQRLELQVQAIVGDGAAKDGEKSVSEWQAILEEKTSTQHGLLLCAQLSAQIERFQSTSQESSTFTDRPSAYKYMKSGLESAKGSIQSIVSRLETHEDEVDRQLEVLSSSVGPMPEDAREQLARLQETKQSLRQCINVVADASHTLAEQRHNVFEDITMADDSYDFSVSTVGDLVTARRLTLKGRSRHVGGQLSDESYQKTIDAITTLDLENLKRMQHSVGQTVLGSQMEDTEATKQFSSRYGPGVRLPPSRGRAGSPRTS